MLAKIVAVSLTLLLMIGFVWGVDERFKGCFVAGSSKQTYSVPQFMTVDQCVEECRVKYYRYSLLKTGGLCTCGNYLGEEVNSTLLCAEYCHDCDLKANLTDVYMTGSLVSGPPENVSLTNITDSSVHISWQEPKSHTEISSYMIKAVVNHTYAKFIPNTHEWSYTNDTFRTKIILLPATKYNISLAAVSPHGLGAAYSEIIETLVGEPSDLPEAPKVVKKMGSKIEIKLTEISNGHGPVTSYLVVVLNTDSQQVFQPELIGTFDEAKREGSNYYIAAELKPENIEKPFTVGDGRYYGRYYNAPLEKDVSYKFIIGVVSTLNGITKRAFGTWDSDLPEEKDEPHIEDSSAVVIGLSIAIGLLSFMLIAGVIGFIMLKSRVTSRRQRLSDNQELTLQGPMIEVENNGYIHEEEPIKVNHYRNLKQKVRSIPYSQLKIEPTNLLGIGRFGRVNSGSIYENNTLVPVAAYSISDKKLSTEDKKSMLRDLDLLIKTGTHDNIVALVGTCETSQIVIVVLEYVSMNLKDLLLGSRDSLPGRFSNMSENQALDIAVNVAKGMAHLEANKIVHKQICARNVLIANGFVPKISGYGIAQYYSHNNLPDYTRWTALEVFREQAHNAKSDIWSYGCLLWEICVLGGTPYGNFSNNEIPEKITKGLRLPQMQYFSDELYQLMLNCWQIDMDERPKFNELVESLEVLNENTLIPCLNFTLYPNFQYEQFYPDMEIAVRPVF